MSTTEFFSVTISDPGLRDITRDFTSQVSVEQALPLLLVEARRSGYTEVKVRFFRVEDGRPLAPITPFVACREDGEAVWKLRHNFFCTPFDPRIAQVA